MSAVLNVIDDFVVFSENNRMKLIDIAHRRGVMISDPRRSDRSLNTENTTVSDEFRL